MDLLERDQHLDHLAELLHLAAAGQGRLVLVGGEAGVGKTTLTDEFCRRVAESVAVLRTSCDALSTPGPLGPVRDLAPALGLQIDPHSHDNDARDRLFREVLAAFAARPGPTVVVAEDATGPTVPRWSCSASSAGGLAISRSWSSLRTATTRSGPITPSVWFWAIWRQHRPSSGSASDRCQKRLCNDWHRAATETPPPCIG